jgi:hypothetical protein
MCDKCNENIKRLDGLEQYAEVVENIKSNNYTVGRYLRTQHYGGSEEGGWYYDRYEYLNHSVKYECWGKALEARDNLNKGIKEKVHWQDWPELDENFWGSMKMSTETLFMLEIAEKGSNDNTDEPRPYYE